MSNLTINLPTSSIQTLVPSPPDNQRRPFLTPIPGCPGEFLLVFDNTSLDKLKRCHKAGRNYLILGREPHARNAALTFGGAIHEGLDRFHHEQAMLALSEGKTQLDYEIEKKAISEFGPAIQDAAVIRYFTENPPPSSGFPDYRTVNCALEVLKHYRRRSNPDLHPDYEWEIQSDSFGPIIERAFEIPMGVLEFDGLELDGQTISKIHLAWSGRIDLIAKVNGKNHIVDNKTNSIEYEKFIKGFELSSQIMGYVFASETLYPEFEISSFCLNAITLKAPSKTNPNIGLMDRGPRGGEPRLRFDRNYYNYLPDQIERWKRDTILLIEDFLHSFSRAVFPMNDSACVNKYGQCPYWDACTIPSEEVGDRYLSSDAFKDVTWNPTANR